MHSWASLALNWQPGWLAAEFSGQAVRKATGYQPDWKRPSRACSETCLGAQWREGLNTFLKSSMHFAVQDAVAEQDGATFSSNIAISEQHSL